MLYAVLAVAVISGPDPMIRTSEING